MKRALGLCSAVAILTFLAACDEDKLRIDRVEPAEGITAGGDSVNILAAGLQPGKTGGPRRTRQSRGRAGRHLVQGQD
jgi:hypothetical protein